MYLLGVPGAQFKSFKGCPEHEYHSALTKGIQENYDLRWLIFRVGNLHTTTKTY